MGLLEQTSDQNGVWEPETPIGKEYLRYLRIAEDIFMLEERHLCRELSLDMLRRQSVALLSAYRVEPEFLRDPENGLMTLAIAQGLVQEEDGTKREQLFLAFAYGLHKNGSGDNFSFSELVRELYNPDYTPRATVDSTHVQQKRESLTRSIEQQVAAAPHTLVSRETGEEINGIEIEKLIGGLCSRLHIDITHLPEIEIQIIRDRALLNGLGLDAYTGRFADGRRIITIAQDASLHEIEHEALHAFLVGVRRGYEGVWWLSAEEGGTELLTEAPTFYESQQEILMEIFLAVGDSSCPDDFFEGLKGDRRRWINFLTTLVKYYGLEAYLQLGLLGSEAADTVSSYVPEAKGIFRDPSKVLDFFSNPDVINN